MTAYDVAEWAEFANIEATRFERPVEAFWGWITEIAAPTAWRASWVAARAALVSALDRPNRRHRRTEGSEGHRRLVR